MRTLVINLTKNRALVVSNVPDNAKITFGPLVPGRGQWQGGNTNYLRIYLSKDVQIAVFKDVESFYDSTLSINPVSTLDAEDSADQVEVEPNPITGEIPF